MAKGSVRKKGKKWYYRFYVEAVSYTHLDVYKRQDYFLVKKERMTMLLINKTRK